MRPEHDPYPSEAARQGAMTKRLVVVIAILAGAVVGLLVKTYVG
jgi:hypothetical protein